VSVEASGKNMKVVCEAKEHHNKTCPYGGTATAVHMSFFDIERLGWEEGDTICGLTLVGDGKIQTGRLRVTCDAEPDNDGQEQEAVEEVVDAVSTRERELQPVGPSSN
jgi:hypothetical protein